jgi:hypothetical protein
LFASFYVDDFICYQNRIMFAILSCVFCVLVFSFLDLCLELDLNLLLA